MLAARVIREGGAATPDRLRCAVRLVLARAPLPREAEVLTALYDRHLKQYTADAEAAKKLLQVGDARAPDDLSPAELAACGGAMRDTARPAR